MFKRKDNRGVRYVVIVGALVALVFLVNVGAVKARLAKFGLYDANPDIYFKNKIDKFAGKILAAFRSRKDLIQKNDLLIQENLLLKSKADMKDILEEENLKILQAFGRNLDEFSGDEDKGILGTILYRPPYSDFDTLIIDAGLEEGVEKGMTVTAFGDIILGHIDAVSKHTSKVKLISFFGEETNIFLEPAGIPAIAQGIGGGNLRIVLPKDSKIEEGEKILTAHVKPLFAGIVERIQRSDSDFFLKAFFRFPINIQEIRYVLVKYL